MWTATDKLNCVQRELKYRIRVYARLVAEGKLSERQASREIAIMAAIVDDYTKVVAREAPELELE